MNPKTLALAAVALVFSMSGLAHAQDVSAVPSSYVATWADPAPQAPKDATLGQAIAMLMPSTPGFYALVQGSSLEKIVTWPGGVSRMEALHDVLEANGLYAMGGSDYIKIFSRGQDALESGQTVRILARYTPASAEPVKTSGEAKPSTPSETKGSEVPPVAASAAAPVAASVAASVAAPVAAPVAPAVTEWELKKGQHVSEALKAWAKASGWVVEWSLSKDWVVPQNTKFSGSFEQATADAVKALAANGADIRAVFYSFNQTVAIRQAGN